MEVDSKPPNFRDNYLILSIFFFYLCKYYSTLQSEKDSFVSL